MMCRPIGVQAGQHRDDRGGQAHDTGERQVELADDERAQRGDRQEQQRGLRAEDGLRGADAQEVVRGDESVDDRHQDPDAGQGVPGTEPL
jgi:hypothetical protein